MYALILVPLAGWTDRYKDMGLAKDIANAMGSPLQLGSAAEKIYGDVVRDDPELSNKDFSSVYRYLRLAANQKTG